jgi:hypothetical protein
VVDKHPRDRCASRTTGGREAGQQHLLLYAEVKLTLTVPELEKSGLCLGVSRTVSSAEALGNEERLMMIAGKSPKGWMAFH